MSTPLSAVEIHQKIGSWRELLEKNDLTAAEQLLLDDIENSPSILIRLLSITYQRIGDGQKATKFAILAADADPADLSAHIHLASIHFQNSNLAKSEASAKEALNVKPDYPAALVRMGEIALRRGDVRGAHHYADQVLSVDENHLEALLCRAYAHLAVDERDYAEIALEKVISINPKILHARHRLDYLRGLSDRREPAHPD
jgi:tetratricopeptide (TPR) repeat protein